MPPDQRLSGQPRVTGVVSVVIPCYNQAHFLAEAIESILAQSYQPIEIIVVDDGSIDNTSAVVTRYPEVRGFRQSNQGLAAARNTGLRAARGEYVLFLDADDLLLPHALEVGVEALRRRPNVAFTFGHTMFMMEDGSVPPEPHRPRLEADPYAQLLAGCPIMCPPLFRRSVFDRVAAYNPALRAAEDYDLYYRISRRHPIDCQERVVFIYRRHGSSMTSASSMRALLRANMTALRRQRLFVWRHPRYWSAYRSGVRYWTAHYGNPLIREVHESVRQHRWLNALRSLGTLTRWWPRGAFLALRTPQLPVFVPEWRPGR